MAEIGTKSVFKAWLLSQHRLTHTAYTKLDGPRKESIYDEFKKRKK